MKLYDGLHARNIFNSKMGILKTPLLSAVLPLDGSYEPEKAEVTLWVNIIRSLEIADKDTHRP